MEQGSISIFVLEHIATFAIGIVIGAYLKRFVRFAKKYLYIFGDKISSKNRFNGTWTGHNVKANPQMANWQWQK